MSATKPRSSIKTTRTDAAIAKWVPDSSGRTDCPRCGRSVDYLTGITLAGICVRCAAKDPSLTVTLRSDPFWLLTPEEMDRVAVKLRSLHAEYERLESSLPEGDWDAGGVEGPTLDEMTAIDREVMLLQMLRVVSRMGGTR